MTAITDAYFSNLIGRLETLKTELAEPMALAANAILEAARNDKRVYVFGTGHSHMLAEEVHYRAGGPLSPFRFSLAPRCCTRAR